MGNRFAIVTGAAGFVGEHMARQLVSQGWDVGVIGHGTCPVEGLRYQLDADISVDALASLSSHPPEQIFHCAGSGSVSHSVTNPLQDFERTVSTTAQVLEYARLYAPHSSIVYPSSGAIYGTVKNPPTTESAPLDPVSPYGHHKRMAENLCQLYADQYGLKVAIVRLFSVFGNGLRKQLLWDACCKIAAGKDLNFFGSGCEIRDWLHINDTVALLARAAEHATEDCLTINGGCGVGLEVKTLLAELFSAFDRTDSPVFLGEQRAGDPSIVIADITAAKALEWRPQVDWQNAVHDYVRWFRKTNA